MTDTECKDNSLPIEEMCLIGNTKAKNKEDCISKVEDLLLKTEDRDLRSICTDALIDLAAVSEEDFPVMMMIASDYIEEFGGFEEVDN